MKVALTVWDGHVAPVFDVSQRALILTIEDGVVTARHEESIETPSEELKVNRLLGLGADTLICGAISEPLYQEITARGMRVFGFVAGEIDEALRAFLSGGLEASAFSMPGCSGRQHRFRGGRGGRGAGPRRRWGRGGRGA